MQMCWFCHFGWPKPVAEIYDRYEAITGYWQMCYGPAHIVWADENFGSDSIQWCIDHADEHRHSESTDADHAAIIESLRELLAIEEGVRFPREATAYYDAGPDSDIEEYAPAQEMARPR